MIALTHDAIDLAGLEGRLHRAAVGGIVTFAGTVRDHHEGRQVLYLEYEAYEEMARLQLERVAAAMRERWPVLELVLVHRVGRLEIGEAAVFVGVACAHRDAAFAACRYGIDTVKAEVPIWKREVFEGGAVWVEGCGHSHAE